MGSSIKKDSTTQVLVDSFQLKGVNSDIKSKIDYEATDSIIYDLVNKKMYLYNNSKVKYEDINIDAYYINYDWPTGVMTATQKKGDSGKILGKPLMVQDKKEYETEKLTYNFKTQKGKVFNVVTQEGEGYLHGEQVKKDSAKNWFVSEAKYTTCDLEHPHFHIKAKKLKLIPNNAIITGPANIVINDIPTPLYLPFGIFPLKKGRRSGIILPQQYNFTPVFNLQDFGYYFGLNNYMDLTLRSTVYFNGSYEFKSNFRYNKNYKYNGEFSYRMHRTFIGDADDPTVRASTPLNFNFSWIHTQNPKAHPTFRFLSNLQYMTQGAFSQSLILNNTRINSQINSTLSLTKTFRYVPITLTSSINYTQDLATKAINGKFPNVQMNYNGNLFKSKLKSKWYDNLNFQYNTQFNSEFNTKDSLFLSSTFFKELKYGIYNQLTVNLGGIKLLKYINFTPSVNYYDRFYFNRTLYQNGTTKLDTIQQNGFFTVRDFNASFNASTIIVGMYQFSNKSKFIQGLRHQVTPSASFTVAPDFSSDYWGYYRYYNDTNNQRLKYSPYSNNLWGAPGNSNAALLSFGLRNTLEGKFYSKKDSITHSKKVSIIDLWNISGTYNFNADSNKLSNINMSVVNSMSKFVTFNANFSFDPYQYKNNHRIKEFLWSNSNKLARLTNVGATLNLTLNNNNLGGKKALNSTKGTEAERMNIYNTFYNYYDFNIPWNLSMSINTNMSNTYLSDGRDTTLVSASLMLNQFNFNLTKNWKLAITSGYNFNLKEIGMTTISAIRNMHCWEFRVNYTPISNIGQAYSIEIRPKSALLQDLKITRNRPALDNFF